MKCISFRSQGRVGFGVVDGDEVAVLGGLDGAPVATLQARLAEGAGVSASDATSRLALKDVELLAPIAEPGAIFCVGLNYAPHIAEMGREMPTHPAIFMRLPRNQVGQGAPLVLPSASASFDYEGELAVVIGKGGRYIAEAQALGHVAGYSCFNDGSIRDYQRHTHQFTPGKNFWSTGSFGPWLVTPDEFGEVGSHGVTTRLNGAVMQQAPFSDLVFTVPFLISYISTFNELRTGDVIITGTPGGVGAARKPPVFMKAGDVVEVEIDGIGILSNPIVAESTVEVPGDRRR